MSKELDKLIEQMLSERINIRFTDFEDINGTEYPSAQDLEDKLNLPTSPDDVAVSNIRNVTKLDKSPKDLTDTDVKRAYDTSTRTPKFKGAEYIRSNTTDRGLKKDFNTKYNKGTIGKAKKESTKAYNTAKKSVTNALGKKDTIERFQVWDTLWLNWGKRNDQDPLVKKPDLSKGGSKTTVLVDIFKDSFEGDDLLRLLAAHRRYAATGREPVVRLKAEVMKDISKIEKKKIRDEPKYTSNPYEANDALSLKYFRGTKNKDPNYNYTIFSENEITPWFLDKGSIQNQLIIEDLLNDEDKHKNYLKTFSDMKTDSTLAEKVFLYNITVFQAAIQRFQIDTSKSEFWKKMVSSYSEKTKVDPEVKPDLERTSVTNPAIMSQAAGKGRMLANQFTMFETFFEGTPVENNPLETLSKRVKKITDFSKELYDVDGINEDQKTQFSMPSADGETIDLNRTANKYVDFLNKTMVLDYFNTMAKELDSGAGAYVFEAFCAYLAGGRVAGKETGLKGGMGETDFFFDSGAKGSAKYLATNRKFSQSVDNFLQGVTVTYVFAAKKGKEVVTKRGKTKRGTASDPDEIHVIDMYVVDVKRLDQKVTDDKASFEISAYGQEAQILELDVKSTSVYFDVDKFTPAGTMYLVSKNKESIMDDLGKLADTMDKDSEIAEDQFKNLVKYFKETFSNLESAKQKVSEYSNTGEKDHGSEALKGMRSAQRNFKKAAGIIKPNEKLQENKKNLGLDQLIQAIAKQKLLK
jgi:hypothetical protein